MQAVAMKVGKRKPVLGETVLVTISAASVGLTVAA